MPDPTLSQAIREAYASAPAGEIIHHTLEFRHPSFLDDEGAPTAIRVVRGFSIRDDMVALTARLEASAPLNAGEMVDWVGIAFDLDLPPVEPIPSPELVLTMDNVGREISDALEAAATSQYKIEVTYRPYLSTDLDGPQMDPPMTLTLTVGKADPLRVTGRARMLNIGNKAFPSIVYTAKNFPRLIA